MRAVANFSLLQVCAHTPAPLDGKSNRTHCSVSILKRKQWQVVIPKSRPPTYPPSGPCHPSSPSSPLTALSPQSMVLPEFYLPCLNLKSMCTEVAIFTQEGKKKNHPPFTCFCAFFFLSHLFCIYKQKIFYLFFFSRSWFLSFFFFPIVF